ncbi:4-hydroxy-3-methylbut-2-enyl diphosphate reductase [Erysipelotrichaceae bacterium RD49]|nr:4-hydroxy-3-methylbut-2-enyl diphosphate reductase [Erysipelotrichaceae bacterium RD49]
MEILDVPVQGFCKGVSKAIETAQKTLHSDCPKPVTVLGSLVHNAYVNQSLGKQGLQVLEAKGKSRLKLLDEIDAGTVIFTAHGVCDQVRAKAEAKGLNIVDASCPFVLATQKLINRKRADGASILYIGKKGHPEAEGAVYGHEGIYLIETIDDLPENLTGPIFVTNQTTMSILDLEALFDQIKERYPQAEFCSEICNATRVRQKAILDLAGQNIDCLIVVGDPQSNNTNRLAQIGQAAGIQTIMQVESASQLDLDALKGTHKVAVTSGASTPAYLKDQVIERLNTLNDQAAAGFLS